MTPIEALTPGYRVQLAVVWTLHRLKDQIND